MSNTVAPPDQYHEDPVLKRTLDWLRGLIPTINSRIGTIEGYGLQKRTRGVDNVTTTAAVSGTASVTHGLGTTPTVVIACAQNSTAGLACVTVASITSTTFTLGLRYTDGAARTLTQPVGWEAIA